MHALITVMGHSRLPYQAGFGVTVNLHLLQLWLFALSCLLIAT